MRLSTTTAYKVVALALGAVLLTASTTVAVPAPSAIPSDLGSQTFLNELQRRQIRLEDLKAQLDELDRLLAIAVEDYNGAAEQLESTQERLNVTEQDLGDANVALGQQQALLETRVDAMYRDGELNAAEILLGAKSLPELFDRIEFVRTISSADADLAKQLTLQRDQIGDQELELKTQELLAKDLEFRLKARRIEIELRIAERKRMLATTEKDLLKLLDSEAARRAGIEADLFRDIISGASRIGVKVEPGSPVETALSYHGVPYVWGGMSPRTGFDCSGLVKYVYAQHGVTLSRCSYDQIEDGTRVSGAQKRPGDLVFFGRETVYHVGMYIGGDYFVHAPRTGDVVKISRLSERHDLVGIRRYDWRYRIGPPLGVAGVSLPGNLPGQFR